MPGYHLPPFAAVEAKLFDQFGLDVEIVELAGGPANVHSVAAGEVDFTFTSVLHFLRAWDRRPALGARFVFVVAQRSPWGVYVVADKPLRSGVIPRHPRDLKGAALGGTPDSSMAQEWRKFGKVQFGWRPEDMPLVEMPYSTALVSIGSGKFDIFVDGVDMEPRIREKNPGVDLRSFHFAEYGNDVYGSGLLTSDRMIQERPDTVLRVVRALRAMYEYSRRHPTAGLESFMRRFQENPPHVVLETWTATQRAVFGWDAARFGPGWFEPGRFERTVHYEAEVLGLQCPPVETTYDARFVHAAASPSGAALKA